MDRAIREQQVQQTHRVRHVDGANLNPRPLRRILDSKYAGQGTVEQNATVLFREDDTGRTEHLNYGARLLELSTFKI